MAAEEDSTEDTPSVEELVEVRLQDLPRDVARNMYYSILEPAFRPEELMTFDEIESAYAQRGNDPSCVILRHGEPVAVMLGEWYANRRVLLLSYLAVAAEARGQRIGTRLIKSVLPRWHAGIPGVLVVAEVDDPRSWPGEDGGLSAEATLRFYDRHGARLLPLRYFQPSLRSGSPRVHGMFLLRLDDSRKVPSDTLPEFLREYFGSCEGVSAFKDPDVNALLTDAARLDVNGGIWPVSQWMAIGKSEHS